MAEFKWTLDLDLIKTQMICSAGCRCCPFSKYSRAYFSCGEFIKKEPLASANILIEHLQKTITKVRNYIEEAENERALES